MISLLVDGVATLISNSIFIAEMLRVAFLVIVAINLYVIRTGCSLFARDTLLNEGDLAERTYSELTILVGFFLVGRIIDPICTFLDE